jgi:hypothetical protein
MYWLWFSLIFGTLLTDALAARDWQANCGYEDCAGGSGWGGLIIWGIFLVAALIGAAREGWRTFSIVVVWLLLLGLTLYGWLAWAWHWLPFVVAMSAIWWWPKAKKFFTPAS